MTVIDPIFLGLWRPRRHTLGIDVAGIKPRIDRRYPLAEIAAALRDVHEGRNMGNIVVTM
jgi:NADPH:quinone reductase-like Zn-dependent oxidoreductase